MDKDNFRLRARELVRSLTDAEKLLMLTTHHHPVERLGLNEFFIGTEVARGFVGRDEEHFSTVLPQPIGMASTFDRKLMHELGDIAGNECRAYYNDGKRSNLCVWGPTVDMERDPRWGRTEEAYGEDVFLAGELTAAYTRGLAGDHERYFKTVPTLKHFCANNNEHRRMSCDAYLPLRLKYEYYYAAFMNAVKYGGARSVMTAYNEINGLPALCNPELNTVLKEQWGLWFAVTDGGDFSQTVTAHRYCSGHSEVLAEALKAGCDTMTDSDILTRRAAEKALDEGLLTWEDIDRSLENTLYARLRLGQLSDDCPYDSVTKDVLDSPESRKVNLRAALEQIVLLKNDGILPLEQFSGKIAVVGALADENLMDWYTGHFRGGVSPVQGLAQEFPGTEILSDSLWDLVFLKDSAGRYLTIGNDGTLSFTEDIEQAEVLELQDWGGNWNNLCSRRSHKYLTFADGTLRLGKCRIYDWFTRETFNLREAEGGVLIEEYLGHSRLTSAENGSISFTPERTVRQECLFTLETVSTGRERGAEIARQCSTVIYCTGNHPVQVAKECHDRTTLRLNVQEGMAEHLHCINPRTVMLLISSYPYSICQENEVLPAILWSSHAGAHLGTAAAMTLSGRSNPAGRLPLTWYRSELDLPDIMEYDIESAGTTYMYFRGTPLYPFGYGLSYSSFRYDTLTVTTAAEEVTAQVTVTNISGTDGDEVVQLYFTVTDSAISRPIRKLCGFDRVHIHAGESRIVTLTVPEHILRIYDTHSGRMITESGTYLFTAGGSSGSLPLSAQTRLERESIALRERTFEAQCFDSGSAVRIAWSRKLRRQYVKASGWTGTLVYRDVPFSGATRLMLTASSVLGESRITADCAGEKLELTVAPSNSADDFTRYDLILPEGLPELGDLILNLHDSAAVMDIELM